MKSNEAVENFLSQYDERVFKSALMIREILFENLPDILEQVDLPARMIAYVYGQKYIEMICTIIPSKKGLKLGFYRGIDLTDPTHLLEGTGKISRYVIINSEQQIKSLAIKKLIKAAYAAYKKRIAGLEK